MLAESQPTLGIHFFNTILLLTPQSSLYVDGYVRRKRNIFNISIKGYFISSII